MDETKGVSRMTDKDDRDCNTCEHFDPMTGVCLVHNAEVDPCDEPCECWKDWEGR